MNQDRLQSILERVERGATSAVDASAELAELLRRLPFEDLGFARVDHHRSLRQGFPEVIQFQCQRFYIAIAAAGDGEGFDR